jgi:hypothetical protein
VTYHRSRGGSAIKAFWVAPVRDDGPAPLLGCVPVSGRVVPVTAPVSSVTYYFRDAPRSGVAGLMAGTR